jgi:hypothetical protein
MDTIDSKHVGTRLVNVARGSADVMIEGRYVGAVVRESVVRNRYFRDEHAHISQHYGGQLMGSQTISAPHSATVWVACRWSGTIRTDFGAAPTRYEAVRILENLE